jgi:hypothetical protein
MIQISCNFKEETVQKLESLADFYGVTRNDILRGLVENSDWEPFPPVKKKEEDVEGNQHDKKKQKPIRGGLWH